MSILIKGMEMPEKGHILSVVIKDGKVICANTGKVLSKEVVELPPHGRLIDADALRADYFAPSSTSNMPNYYHVIKAQIDNAPTIIESEEEDEEQM